MDVPTNPPHKAARGGLAALKKLPPVVWIAIAAGMAVIIMYLRHRAATTAAAQSSQHAGATADQASQDASNYGADTNGLDSAYLSGYDSGISSTGGALPTDIFGGANPNGTLPAGTGTGVGVDTVAAPPGVVVNNVFPTGGGAPTRPPDVHNPPPKPKPKPKPLPKPKPKPRPKPKPKPKPQHKPPQHHH